MRNQETWGTVANLRLPHKNARTWKNNYCWKQAHLPNDRPWTVYTSMAARYHKQKHSEVVDYRKRQLYKKMLNIIQPSFIHVHVLICIVILLVLQRKAVILYTHICVCIYTHTHIHIHTHTYVSLFGMAGFLFKNTNSTM